MHYKLSNFPKKQFLLAVLILRAIFVFAIEKVDTTKTYQIKEIVVTEKYRNSETRSTAPLQILSSKQINNLNVLQVSDAVKYFSGVAVKDYGGIGGLKTVSVRSLGAAHTAVNYDGITITDCQTGQIDIGRFSLENVDMLSLNNGQSDNIFQPARLFASAAVLNIRTLLPTFSGNRTLNGNLTMKSGSFGLINPAFWLQKKINNQYSASLSAELLTANGEYPYLLNYSTLEDGLVTKETRKNTDVHNIRLEGTVYGHFSEQASAYIKSYYYQSERGLPGATILYNTDNFSSQRMWDHTFFTQAHYENNLSSIWLLQLNAKYNHGYLHYLDSTYLNETGRMESVFRQNEYYTSASILFRAFAHLSFSFSTDGFVNNMTANYETEALTKEFANPTRFSLLSVVAAKYVSNEFMATASLLSTLVTEKVEVGNPSENQHRLSPYFSFTYKPLKNSDLRLRAFYKNIFRLPTFNDLYYSRIGNADLRPEITYQINVGFTYSFSPFKWFPFISFTMDGYRNYVTDKIIAMPTKNIFVWSMLNLGKVEVNGIDITAETTFSIAKKMNLVMGGTYTYQRALDITTPGGSTYEHQIPYTPRVSGSGKAAIETPWGDISYSLLWSGKRYGGFQNFVDNRLSGYIDHGVSAAHIFKLTDKELKLNIEILNLLNENYSIVKWFPMPGRSVRATIGLKF